MTSMFLKLFSVFLIIPFIVDFLLIKIGGIIGGLEYGTYYPDNCKLGAYPAKNQGFHLRREIQVSNEQGICAWK